MSFLNSFRGRLNESIDLKAGGLFGVDLESLEELEKISRNFRRETNIKDKQDSGTKIANF